MHPLPEGEVLCTRQARRRSQAVQEDAGGATVTLAVEEGGQGNPPMLAAKLQESAEQLQKA